MNKKLIGAEPCGTYPIICRQGIKMFSSSLTPSIRILAAFSVFSSPNNFCFNYNQLHRLNYCNNK